MIEISPERKSASRSKPLVRIGVACMLAAAAAAAAASQIPAFARALTFARFAALGATVGLGVSIASLIAGALFVRGPVAANAIKFGSMALMIVSLGILVGACGTETNNFMPIGSGSMGSYVSGSMNTTQVSVIPAATTITTTQPLSVTMNVNTLTTTGTFAAPGSVVLSSTAGNYGSGSQTLCGPNTTGCAAGFVTIVIPAEALTPGTDKLTAQFTPATAAADEYPAASGTAMVAVTVPTLITPTVTVMPSPTTITTLQALALTVTVSGGGSNPTPTGSVMLTSGPYTSQAPTLTNGSATINIPAGSLAVGTDTVNVFYTPDSNSSGIYNSSSGPGTVTVNLPPPTTPAITVTPSESMITTAQAFTVTVTVTGTGTEATPTGAVALVGGGYPSTSMNLTGGSATFSIPAGALTEGSDTLTATYTPDANSAPIYDSVVGSCVVTVNPPPASAPAMTVTPNAFMITTAQALSVSVTVTGTGATPTGKVQLTGGGYTSAGIALNAGSATINIPAGMLNVGTDTLTVTYTPDANSAATYSINTATAKVTVTSGVTAVALNDPNGLAIDSSNRLYVANSGGNQVLVYTETLNADNVVTGLTQTATITTNISSATRLAFDALGYLYVANLGNNTVTVYDTSFNPVPSGTISTAISRPLGIAVDQTGNVYVGNNNADNITVYTGTPNTGFTLSATLTDDNSGNQFLAPGDITFAKVAGVNELFVGLGPGGGTDSVIIYPAPLRAGSDPATDLTNQNCPTGPNGPTGVATNAAGTTIYITSFYNSTVAEYTFTGIQTGTGCPAPISTSGVNSEVAKPEGVAIDSSGNVFVSNSSANTITVYSTISSAPSFTQH
jgi:YVTN family beta-propeller protein